MLLMKQEPKRSKEYGRKLKGIKSVSLEYSCDEEYLEEFNKGKNLGYSCTPTKQT